MTAAFETLLFCTSYVAHRHAWELRYERWLRHHAAIDFGKTLFCLIDDGSPYQPDADHVQLIDAGQPLPETPDRPLCLRFGSRLGRRATDDFPGWWRSFLHSVNVAEHYRCRKILHIESDAYILTRRMAEFLGRLESGWTAFWCPRWNFPESAIQVIGADRFDALRQLGDAGVERFAGTYAEKVLPFTNIVRDPHGNRYGEFRRNIPRFADFAAQVTPAQKVWFQ